MRMPSSVRPRLFRASFGALVAVTAACGLDVVGTSSKGSLDTDDANAPNGADDRTSPQGPNSGGDADATGGPSSPDATSDDSSAPDPTPGPDASDILDAGDDDAPPSLYRDDWFDRTNESPQWTTTWWKADKCRDRPGAVGSTLGPGIFDMGSKKEVSSPPAADSDSQEPLLEFPRNGSIWPDKKGVKGIAETAEPPLNGGPTNAFCARFVAHLQLPPGTYTLHYDVSDSLVVHVNKNVIGGPKWFESILTPGYGNQKSTAPIQIDDTAEDSQEVRIYYGNVNKDAVLRLRLEGPLSP